MIKVVLLVRRRPGLSREEFRAHYEGTHAPLAARSLAHLSGYTRNFVTGPDNGADPDCITEFWYELEPPWSRARELVADDAIRAMLAVDEARFMDRGSMRTLIVEECASAPSEFSRATTA
jgi:EthD domain